MKFLLVMLAFAGAGMVFAPAVGRTVRTRVQKAEGAAQKSVQDVEQNFEAGASRWEDRIADAVENAGAELEANLPKAAPEPPGSPGSNPSPTALSQNANDYVPIAPPPPFLWLKPYPWPVRRPLYNPRPGRWRK